MSISPATVESCGTLTYAYALTILEKESVYMSYFRGKYYVEYVCGHTYVNVFTYEVDKFGRLTNMKMVFRSESVQECNDWIDTH